MPWYWSDELAQALLADGRIDADTASRLAALPFALRSEELTVEEAAGALADDGEIPLAA